MHFLSRRLARKFATYSVLFSPGGRICLQPGVSPGPAAVITLEPFEEMNGSHPLIGLVPRPPEDTPHPLWSFRQWPDCDGTTDLSAHREAAVAPPLRSIQRRGSLAHSSRGKTRLHPPAKTDNSFVQVMRAFETRDPAPQPFANGRLIAPQQWRRHTRRRDVFGDVLNICPTKPGRRPVRHCDDASGPADPGKLGCNQCGTQAQTSRRSG